MNNTGVASGRPLEIAVIGAGSMGQEHVVRLLANPRCRVAAVVDPRFEAAEWAGKNRFTHYADIRDLLSSQRLDGAIVATPNDLHVPSAVSLLDVGVPVLVEKPIAESLASGQELARKVRETGVPALIGHHRRYSAAIQAAISCIARGTLGRIVALNVTTLFHKPEPYFEAVWRRGASGGPILINLVHDIDSLRALSGEIIAVQAVGSSRNRGFAAEDTAAAILEFKNGALGSMLLSDTTVASNSWEHTSGENSIFPRDPMQDCILIGGTRGSLAVPTMRIWRQEGDASWTLPFITERLAIKTTDPLASQLDHFCDIIEHDATPRVGVVDALRTLAVTLAVRKSVRTRTRVEIPIS